MNEFTKISQESGIEISETDKAALKDETQSYSEIPSGYQTPLAYQQGYPPSGYQQGYQPPPPGYYYQQQYSGYSETRYVGLLEAYKAYWVNYVNFNDRTSRAGYWWAVLVNFIISITISVIMTVLIASYSAYGGGYAYMNFFAFLPLFIWVWALANLIPCLSLTVRRLHDTGRAWPWIFLALIPLVGVIILIIFFATESKYPPQNQFGVLRQV